MRIRLGLGGKRYHWRVTERGHWPRTLKVTDRELGPLLTLKSRNRWPRKSLNKARTVDDDSRASLPPRTLKAARVSDATPIVATGLGPVAQKLVSSNPIIYPSNIRAVRLTLTARLFTLGASRFGWTTGTRCHQILGGRYPVCRDPDRRHGYTLWDRSD